MIRYTGILPCFLLPLLLLQTGCSGRSQSKPSEEEVNLKKLAVLLGQYRANNRGTLPSNAAQLKTFAAQMPRERLQGLDIDPANIEGLLVSSRDQKPFVFRSSRPTGSPVPRSGASGPSTQQVMIYEQVGKDGKRMVAYETCQVEEIDEKRLRELVPEAP